MTQVVQLEGWMFALIGTIILLLLAIIAFFLRSLINQITSQLNGLRQSVDTLNITMGKIDKDLSSKVGILESQVEDIDEIWGRLRHAEDSITALRNGGCEIVRNCKTQ